MGTKNKPGKFDCYKNAKPDEPMFILLGRDPSACHLVRLWAEVRKLEGEDPNKVIEALDCAQAMERWADRLDKRPRILEAERILAGILLELDRNTLRAAREGAIENACNWVRAHGPYIPNAKRMRSELLTMLDRKENEGRDDAEYYQGLERELEQLENENPDVRQAAKNLEKTRGEILARAQKTEWDYTVACRANVGMKAERDEAIAEVKRLSERMQALAETWDKDAERMSATCAETKASASAQRQCAQEVRATLAESDGDKK